MAPANRLPGESSRQRRMVASQRGSRSGTWVRGEGGGCLRRRVAVASGESPLKGTVPVTIS